MNNSQIRPTPDLTPLNRRLLIAPIGEQMKTESGVLLPDDFRADERNHVSAVVLALAPDCAEHLRRLVERFGSQPCRIVVEESMIEKVECEGGIHHMILENYVVGISKGL